MTARAEARLHRRNFAHIAGGGILFEAGAASVDTRTIVAALVDGMTGSTLAVGAAAAIARYGWLFPQLFVAHLAQRRVYRMPYYRLGAYGRVVCLSAVAALLWFGVRPPGTLVVALFFALWTTYAFISGIVAVPYNDIVGRAIPSGQRSRLLALRLLGGGLLALAVAAAAHRILAAPDRFPFPTGYAAIFLLGAGLLAGSATSFATALEPPAPLPRARQGFGAFLRGGLEIVRSDRRFRLFLGAQWLGGVVAMSLPFYLLQVIRSPVGVASDAALFVGAQTVGALVSNPLWGWWGDRRGKLSLLRLVVALAALAPALTLGWLAFGVAERALLLPWFAAVFFLLGAVLNGTIIAQLGYLMEISPDDRRPAYSGYFNALVAPASLLPIAGAAMAGLVSFAAVFASSLFAALLQMVILRRLEAGSTGSPT